MPPISINAVEAFWIGINTLTLILTFARLVDAWEDRQVIMALNGHAREVAALGNIRREALRGVVQVILLLVALPGIFSTKETPLNPLLALFISIPVILLINSYLDTRDRKTLTRMATEEIVAERETTIQRIEKQNQEIAAALKENTRVTQLASDNADVASQAATDRAEVASEAVTENTRVTQKASDTADAAYEEAHSVNEAFPGTSQKVTDIYEATVVKPETGAKPTKKARKTSPPL